MPKDLLPQDLDIHICGKDLPSSTFGGPVSSFAVLSKLDINTNLFEEVGRTEWIGKNCNPEFVNTIRIVYHFETVQVYRVVFYQSPLEVVPQDLSTIPVVGVAEFDVSQFVVADSISDGRKSLPLSTRGFAEIRVIVAVEDLNILQFKLKGTLHSNNWVQNPHPYLVISRLAENSSTSSYIASKDNWIRVVVYRNPTLRTKTPDFGNLNLSIQKICNGDHHCPLKFEIYDDINSKLIGELPQISVSQILRSNNIPLPLGPQGGALTFINPQIIERRSWLDYIKYINVSLSVSIDYTQSNGNQTLSDSLHFLDPSKLNIYEQCIKAVGDVVIRYDSDKKVPVYGFGAKIKDKVGRWGPTNHCFALTDEEVVGVEGILEAYKTSFTRLQLAGPSLLEPTIRHATELAKKAAESTLNYTIHLIITDGNVQDMEQTIDAIIDASSEPISFIIMGVGGGDEDGEFTNMEILDSDDQLLASETKQAKRDIVQFVRYLPDMNPTVLAAHVLQEIPDQITGFYEEALKGKPDLFSHPL
mmetsp:Transcript_31385/g.34265  ORF Transcript_31385/g.34265 Transcript_31385/m.34265 type:complete len:530 (+) Transcript_31385:81-1670(+)|eukprot:CAMPEP_0173143848 /NCGR_PEP_ID=MMETSP1105-20130129/6899_1 /TAXON_ID=2985 /ORGANISM="Ochromonas sp., Strain BG-1" /LENGTH=529 /DNA_ID=CAMNT_0014057451 /DNA_START=70 /DNA_END=1659 /DNA_ORIENTATION=+